MIRTGWALLFCACVPWGSNADEKALAAEWKKLEGEWKIVAAEMGGATVEASDVVAFSTGKCKVTNTTANIVFENTVTLDPSKKPRLIELTNTKSKERWLGIYDLEGDKLRCLFYSKDDKTPTEFKTAKGTLQIMYTYERVKK